MVFYQETNSVENYNYNLNIYKNCEWGAHFHKNFEFVCVLDGELEVFCDEKSEVVKKDEFVIIFPNEVHSFSTKENSVVWVGVFSKDFIMDFANLTNGKTGDRLSFSLNKNELTYLKEVLLCDDQRDIMFLKSSLYMICARFLKEAELIQKDKGKTDLAHRIIEFTENNFKEQMSMKDVADALGFEYHYFSRCFKSIFHINFKLFLNQYRFAYARELIMNTNMSMTEISEESGFGSLRNFNRIYKEMAKITPIEQKNAAGVQNGILVKKIKSV